MELKDRNKFEELKATGRLPSPKGVALALINLTQQEDFTASEVTHVVQSDPALAGRLLKLANSSRQGLSRPVVSLSQAVMLLGIPMVRNVALGLSLLTENMEGVCKSFDFQRFWSRSLASAISNQWLGYRAQTAADETFTCGLLSQVGRLALAILFPQEYSEVLDEAAGKPVAELLKLEQGRFAIDHRHLTSALLQDWGLPPLFVEAVFHHEAPEEAEFEEGSRPYLITHSLHFSSYLGEICQLSEEARRRMLPRLYVLGARLGMDADAVNLLSDQVVAEWRDWGTILQVQTHDLPPFAEMAAAMPAVPTVLGGKQQFPLRVLVVDDSPAILALLEKLLTDIGHAVRTAVNGQDGLSKALEWQPQLIITDWVMPEMDGLALCKALRESRAGRMMYLIILTVLEDEEKLVEAFEAGADDYIVKPFSERALKARLRAGQRVVQLQEEILLEREDVRRSAAELAVTNQRLLEAALTDSLTQLPNRRYGLERFDEEWAASGRHDSPLSCMLLDIDRFKQINDTHGHDAGDAVLRQSATLIRKAIRKEDVVCRLGGEEFLVICPAADLKSTALAAERLRLAFEKAAFDFPGGSLKLTASIGVASRDASLPGPEALLKIADQALYTAKQAGRNRVVVYSRKAPSPPAKEKN